MFSRFYEAEIPLKFNWIIIRQDALQENKEIDFLDFLTKFNPLNNEFLCVFISMGSDLGEIYEWVRKNKLVPMRDYYVSNDTHYMCDEKDYPRNPDWLTIFKNEDGLFCDFVSTKNYFLTTLLEFKNYYKK